MRPLASTRGNIAIVTAVTSLLYLATVCVARKSAMELCQTVSAQSSCGQCIKQHPDCAWCSDPDADITSRCEHHTTIIGKCNQRFVEHPVGRVDLTQNAEVGTNRQDPYTGAVLRTQFQPQQVQISLKPGEAVSFPLRYQHQDGESRDIYILNSEIESQGVSIDYEAECRGIIQPSSFCPMVSYAEIITFNVTVQLKECRTSGGNVVSVGIGGVREVVALYINPVCGCDCEKLENQITVSPVCGTRGNLVCGACVCNPGSAGAHCECDISSGSLSMGELMNQCRMRASDPLCSDRGKCKCGACECDSPKYSGKYCQCDDTACPSNGVELCSGQGKCECGTCTCEPGWTGAACDCTTETTECLGKGGLICNGQGTCECGKCVCNAGYNGPTCELCLSCDHDFDQEVAPGDHDEDDYQSVLPDSSDGTQPDDTLVSDSVPDAASRHSVAMLTSIFAPIVFLLLSVTLMNGSS